MAIVLALAAFVLAVLLHGLAMRAPLQLDSVRRFMLIGVPLGVALVTVSLARFGPTLPGIAAILLYALLCELYIFLFTLVLSSVSATMLIMLRRGPVQASALASVYDPQEMVQLRLDRLLRNGFVARASGRFSVTEKGERLHRIFTGLRRFFGHESR
ncbi:MAG: hypothetical protein EWM73_03641 [Nitrospira sp.]|nr:MAG: hypothetical protein EWM73_03641 [Nitrospira sp.]